LNHGRGCVDGDPREERKVLATVRKSTNVRNGCMSEKDH
jgi:hypothetical protein